MPDLTRSSSRANHTTMPTSRWLTNVNVAMAMIKATILLRLNKVCAGLINA